MGHIMEPSCVLCVDDEPGFADLTATHLERFDDQFTTKVKTNAEDALEFLHENHVDCIVSDYNMPEMDGLVFLQAVRTTDPELPFFLFTGRGSEEIASEAISAGVTDYLQKGSGAELYTLLGQRVKNAVSRYRTRLEKQEVEIRGETILNASPDAIVVSVNTEFVYANPKAIDLYGVPDGASLLGRTVEEFIHPDYRDAVTRKLQSVESGERPANHIPRTLFTIGGEEVPVEVTSRHVSWEGEPGVVAIVRDITERTESTLSPHRYRALFEHANDAMALVGFQDGAPVILEINSAFESLFAPDEDVVGRDLDEVVVAGERMAEAKEITHQAENPEFVRAELTRDTVDGPRDFLWQQIPLEADQTGEIESTFAVYTDITERKERGRELEQQNARLEEFVGVVSHDLRNPLNVAQGRLELATEECESEHLDDVEVALDRTQTLIDDLLSLAREGKLVGDMEPVELDELVVSCWDGVANVKATLHVDEKSPTIKADKSRLRQLLENLFRNAVQHGGEDVTVTVGALDDGFFIEDDGLGIPEEDRDMVFEPGKSTSDDGTGFGLAIVRGITEAHGWSITVTDGTDGGSRFEITSVDFPE